MGINDDLAMGGIRPVVLIATHQRIEITSQNIESLLKQSLKPIIILVVSSVDEYKHFSNQFPAVDILTHPNRPLGAKWQAGVDCSWKYYPNPLIITGSDDILGKGFIKNAVEFIERGYDFIGLNQWYVHNVRENKVHLFKYMAHLPLGGGRVFSGKLLTELNYQLFDKSKERLLDDKAWANVRSSKILISDLPLLAVKGDWPVMNPVERMYNHPNVQLLKTYEPEGILQELFGR